MPSWSSFRPYREFGPVDMMRSDNATVMCSLVGPVNLNVQLVGNADTTKVYIQDGGYRAHIRGVPPGQRKDHRSLDAAAGVSRCCHGWLPASALAKNVHHQEQRNGLPHHQFGGQRRSIYVRGRQPCAPRNSEPKCYLPSSHLNFSRGPSELLTTSLCRSPPRPPMVTTRLPAPAKRGRPSPRFNFLPITSSFPPLRWARLQTSHSRSPTTVKLR